LLILNYFPIWVVYLLVVGLILLAFEIGFRLGLDLRRRGFLQEKDVVTGAMVGALLGLLAFFLAFAIGFALNNYTTRRELVVAEANAIGTAYLRAGYLDEATRAESQELYREYLDLRFIALDPAQLPDAAARGEAIHNNLWGLAEAYAIQNPESDVGALYIQALNEVIDLQTTRLAAIQSLRLPAVVWWIMFSIIVLSFALVGIQSSADGHRNYFALLIFTLAFAAAVVLLADLDNPQIGLLQIGQNAMLSLQQQIGTPMP
jgi:hypothetical protein